MALLGLTGSGDVLETGVTSRRMLAAVLSLALTAVVLHLTASTHPPAGATTLLVSLGFLQRPAQVAALAAGVVLLTLAGWALNLLLGARPAGRRP